MNKKDKKMYDVHIGIPLPKDWKNTMNMERARMEGTLGEVVKYLKKKKKLPKYVPPEKKAWWT